MDPLRLSLARRRACDLLDSAARFLALKPWPFGCERTYRSSLSQASVHRDTFDPAEHVTLAQRCDAYAIAEAALADALATQNVGALDSPADTWPAPLALARLHIQDERERAMFDDRPSDEPAELPGNAHPDEWVRAPPGLARRLLAEIERDRQEPGHMPTERALFGEQERAPQEREPMREIRRAGGGRPDLDGAP
jgi:hypothetical protein